MVFFKKKSKTEKIFCEKLDISYEIVKFALDNHNNRLISYRILNYLTPLYYLERIAKICETKLKEWEI